MGVGTFSKKGDRVKNGGPTGWQKKRTPISTSRPRLRAQPRPRPRLGRLGSALLGSAQVSSAWLCARPGSTPLGSSRLASGRARLGLGSARLITATWSPKGIEQQKPYKIRTSESTGWQQIGPTGWQQISGNGSQTTSTPMSTSMSTPTSTSTSTSTNTSRPPPVRKIESAPSKGKH